MKRDSKGRFLKRGRTKNKGKKAKRRIGGARKGSKMSKKRRSRRGTAGAPIGKVATKAKVAAAGALYGYAKERTKWLQNAAGEPYRVDAIGQDATVMVAAHLLAAHGPRVLRRPLDYLGLAIAGHLGIKAGAAGDLKAALQGPGDDDLVGAVDTDDFLPDGEESDIGNSDIPQEG